MARLPSTDYDPEARRALLGIARGAIQVGLERFGIADAKSVVDVSSLPAELLQPRATFVTLTKAGSLRGCTGSLEAVRPLALDVVENACHSAFRDPRFPPIQMSELLSLRIELSVLSPLEPVPVSAVDSTPMRSLSDVCAVHAAPVRASARAAAPNPNCLKRNEFMMEPPQGLNGSGP